MTAHRWSIGTSLFLGIGLLCFVAIASIGTLAVVINHSAVLRGVLADLYSTATEKTQAFLQWTRDRRDLLDEIDRSPWYRADVHSIVEAAKTGDATVARRVWASNLAPFYGESSHLKLLEILDPETGEVLACTDPSRVGTFQENQKYFLLGKETVSVLNPFYHIATQQLAITVSGPVFGFDGRLLAVSVAFLNLSEVTSIFDRTTEQYDTDEAYVVNTDHLFLTPPHRDSDSAILRRGARGEAIDRVLAHLNGSVLSNDYRGVPVISVYSWIPEQQVGVIVSVEQGEAFSYETALIQAVVVFGLFLLLGSVLLAQAFTRSIVGPLHRLGEAAWRLGRGELYSRVVPQGGHELVVLANEFNRMAEQIEDQHTQLRLRTQEALAATAVKSDFLANMSHEIRSPLNAVIGMIQILQRSSLSPEQLTAAGHAERAAQILLEILNSVLDFSKIEAGQIQLEARPFSPLGLLQDLSVILKGTLNDEAVKLVLDVDPALPAQVVGDELRLRQVLLNLGGNALKFTSNGVVTIEVRAESLGGQVRIEFAVVDTGIGIEADKLQEIFQSFVQAEASTSRRFGGTGLGLSIAKRLVGLMGGEIQVESTLGVGSRFSFQLTFPIADSNGFSETEARASSAGGHSRALQGLKLLVVDDQLVNLLVARGLLEGLGAIVEQEQSGAMALQRLLPGGARFDAVLLDIQMPELDGYEVARRLRAQFDSRELPIIAMTANVTEEDRLKSMAAGMNGHIAKPIDQRVLVETLLGLDQVPSLPEFEPRLKGIDAPLELILSIVDEFVKSQENWLAEITQAQAAGDGDQVLALLHRLKGSAGAVGAAGLARELERLEQSYEVDSGSSAGQFQQVQTQLAEVVAWLRTEWEPPRDP